MKSRWLSLVVVVCVWIALIFFGEGVAQSLRSVLNPSHSVGEYSDIKLPPSSDDATSTFVFSKYPFNFKEELIISGRSDLTLKVGAPIAFGGSFIGQIDEVFADAARVITIFDSRLQLPVRIGDRQVDAVLEGGPSPTLTLIPEEVSSGEEVYSADPNVPYGLFVGVVGDIRVSKDKLFRSASLEVQYNPGELRHVSVLENPTSFNQ